MAREGGGVYDMGSATGGKVEGLPQGMELKPTASKAPTGRPGVGGNPLSADVNSAAKKGVDDVRVNG